MFIKKLMVYRTTQKTWSDTELHPKHENLIGWEAAALKYLNQSVLGIFFSSLKAVYNKCIIGWIQCEYQCKGSVWQILDTKLSF